MKKKFLKKEVTDPLMQKAASKTITTKQNTPREEPHHEDQRLNPSTRIKSRQSISRFCNKVALIVLVLTCVNPLLCSKFPRIQLAS